MNLHRLYYTWTTACFVYILWYRLRTAQKCCVLFPVSRLRCVRYGTVRCGTLRCVALRCVLFEVELALRCDTIRTLALRYVALRCVTGCWKLGFSFTAVGRKYDAQLGRFCVTTLGAFLAPHCLWYQAANSVWTSVLWCCAVRTKLYYTDTGYGHVVQHH